MKVKLMLLALVPFVVVGCSSQTSSSFEKLSEEAFWEQISDCNRDLVCAINRSLVLGYSGSIGSEISDGATLRSIKTDDRTTTLGVTWTTESGEELPEDSKWEIAFLESRLQKSLCSDKASRQFFELGGGIAIEAFLPSGRLYGRTEVSSC